jgi:hypothetical protein
MTRPNKLVLSFALLIGLFVAFASPASAATPKRVWSATIGSSRVLALTTVTLNPNYSGAVRITTQGLKANTTYQAMIYKGTCSSPTALVRLPGVRTDVAGNAQKTMTLTVNNGYSIWSTARAGSIAIRLATGSTAYCARLTFPVATRVQVSRYSIDLPIVAQPSGIYPYCNVAMYSSALSQPGEAGPTFIYAHARTGMFLPLLNASISNAAAMIGTTVRVWASDSTLHTYRISRVLRHQYSIPAYSTTSEILWLQTSEGPHGTRNKLFMLATPVSVTTVGYAEAHPTPHIVRCGF